MAHMRIPPEGSVGAGMDVKEVPHGVDITVGIRRLRGGIRNIDVCVSLIKAAFQVATGADDALDTASASRLLHAIIDAEVNGGFNNNNEEE